MTGIQVEDGQKEKDDKVGSLKKTVKSFSGSGDSGVVFQASDTFNLNFWWTFLGTIYRLY